mmetsp:Transcript_105630/g.147258  ORF Transcript_105630/g.147258 Transcript_105630/m.147258 type:complete len:207 (+) Transcript_105630:108-728(+)
METSILIEGFGKSFSLDLRLSSLDLQLTALQSVLAILEHSIRASTRAEDQKLLQMQIDEVEKLRQSIFTDSIQVTLDESDEEQLKLEEEPVTESVESIMENMAEMDDMAVKRVNAMKGLLPELPGGVPENQEERRSSDASFSSKSSEMAAVPTAEPGGSSAKHQARRHTWGLHFAMPSERFQKEVKDTFHRFTHRGSRTAPLQAFA